MSWELIDSYFKNKNIAQMEIDSFNQFIDQKLQDIVKENSSIVPKIEEVRIELSDIEVEKPKIIEADGSPRDEFTPMEARLKNRTYAGPLYLTMRLYRRDVEQDARRTYIGDLPIMTKSHLCWLNGKNPEELMEMGEDPKDFGGYF
ncbi:MAG: DNA-directed RNA polymerase subunit B, partial [archaeon]